MEKNLVFHPKRDRSKSIPTINNMNLRLQALKDMKEDLLLRKCKVSDEIDENEFELKVPVLEYNFNDIKRKIMHRPLIMQVIKPELKKRDPNRSYDENQEEEKVDSN